MSASQFPQVLLFLGECVGITGILQFSFYVGAFPLSFVFFVGCTCTMAAQSTFWAPVTRCVLHMSVFHVVLERFETRATKDQPGSPGDGCCHDVQYRLKISIHWGFNHALVMDVHDRVVSGIFQPH